MIARPERQRYSCYFRSISLIYNVRRELFNAKFLYFLFTLMF